MASNDEQESSKNFEEKNDRMVIDEESEKYRIDEDAIKELEVKLGEAEIEERKDKVEQLKEEGNAYFKDKKYAEGAEVYTDALRQCPTSCSSLRAILYSNRAACFSQMNKKESAINDCTSAIALDPTYVRALRRRASLYEQEEDTLEKAIEDHTAILALQPNDSASKEAVEHLKGRMMERNEKMKTEMMAQLKNLGNTILRPFGLSTDSFKVQTNPDGSYNVQMSK